MRVNKPASYGPWLVGLGAALWGTESAWRIPLNNLFDARVIVFWEHVLIFLMFLPILLPNLGHLRKIDIRTWCFLIFSGFAGSAVGTIFFTLALKHGNPTVVNVILNIQPVISTLGAVLIFDDRLASRFFVYALLSPRHNFSVRRTFMLSKNSSQMTNLRCKPLRNCFLSLNICPTPKPLLTCSCRCQHTATSPTCLRK